MFDARPNLANTAGIPGGSSAKPAAAFNWPRTTSYSGLPRNNNNRTSSPRLNSLRSLIPMEKFNEFREQRLSNLRPWLTDFFNKDQFGVPDGIPMIQNRLFSNIKYFQLNYLIISMVLLIYCVLQHIMLAFLMLGFGAGYFYILSLPEDHALNLGGMVVSKKQMYVGLVIFGIFMFLFTDVSAAFFWLVGICALVIGIHACFHEVSIESDFGQHA